MRSRRHAIRFCTTLGTFARNVRNVWSVGACRRHAPTAKLYPHSQGKVVTLLLSVTAILGMGQPMLTHADAHAQSQPDCRTFSETGKTVCGGFLQYWDGHSGLPQQGLPMTGEFQEISDTNGKLYTVQYFERAVFEKHPENKPPFDVLLSLLGNAFYKQYYLAGAPNQQPNLEPGSRIFKETGKRLGGRFLQYWDANGGLMQQGFPISDEFTERSQLDGKTYRVQYFERAVFELHPENKPPFDILLSQLGTFYVKSKYPNGEPDEWSALRQRPLQIYPIKAGSPCPVSASRIVAPQFGLAFGDGPIYAVLGAEANGVVNYAGARQEGGWFYHKVLWVGSPGFAGPVLVRGRQLDGPRELGFGNGPDPAKELTLRTGGKDPTWSEWPSEARLQGQGCYAFQVDAPDFTKLIVFRATDKP